MNPNAPSWNPPPGMAQRVIGLSNNMPLPMPMPNYSRSRMMEEANKGISNFNKMMEEANAGRQHNLVNNPHKSRKNRKPSRKNRKSRKTSRKNHKSRK
jgi:hypothetical protein